jgi:hypothetical protein
MGRLGEFVGSMGSNSFQTVNCTRVSNLFTPEILSRL